MGRIGEIGKKEIDGGEVERRETEEKEIKRDKGERIGETDGKEL